MNNLEVFNFENKEVRTKSQNNEVWFCLKDVCSILEIKNHKDVVSRLNQKGVDISDTLTNGGMQKVTFINESNLYKVIFQSRKQQAERFTEWVTSEVLPSLRKHGMYATEETIDKILSNPDFGIRLLSELKEEREKTKQLRSENDQLKPKALFADTVSASDTSILIGQLAKLLKQNGNDIGQNRLFKILRKDGYLGKSGENYNLPTQKSMNLKVMEIKERTVNNSDGSVRITKTPMITGKGQVYFVNRYKEIWLWN